MIQRQRTSLMRSALVLLALLNLLAFQNCSGGFKTATLDMSSQGIGGIQDLGLQSKALGILSANCKACHVDQALGTVSNLLDVNHLLASQLVVAGRPDESPLLIEINADRMPPGAPLPSADKSTLRQWVLGLSGSPNNPPAVDLTFTSQVPLEPIPYRARLGKLSVLTGSSTAPSLMKVQNDRLFLGDYDFANAVIPKFSWEATDMKAWMEAMDPICSSAEMRGRFPWPSGANGFLMAAAGRTPTALDNTIIQEISALSVPAQEKFDVFCMTVLTSMEFIAK